MLAKSNKSPNKFIENTLNEYASLPYENNLPLEIKSPFISTPVTKEGKREYTRSPTFQTIQKISPKITTTAESKRKTASPMSKNDIVRLFSLPKTAKRRCTGGNVFF